MLFARPMDDLAYYDLGSNQSSVQPGRFDIMAGDSDKIGVRGRLQVGQ